MTKLPLEYKSTYIHTNSVRLHVIQAGSQTGPLVILLHGFPEFWYGWTKQIPALAAADFRLWIPDQRGYNLSDKPDGISSYQIDYLARDILGLIDAAGEEKAFIVGHDWGAAVAWHIATCYPGWVNKMVILNVPHPSVMVNVVQRNFSQLRKSWYIFFFQIPGLPERLLKQNEFAFLRNALLNTSNPGSFSQGDLNHYLDAWKQPGTLTGMVNWYRAIFKGSLTNRRNSQTAPSNKISVPTLMLWGVNDIALIRELAQPSIDLCTEGKLDFIEQATHWVQHDEPELVSQAIIDFFGK